MRVKLMWRERVLTFRQSIVAVVIAALLGAFAGAGIVLAVGSNNRTSPSAQVLPTIAPSTPDATPTDMADKLLAKYPQLYTCHGGKYGPNADFSGYAPDVAAAVVFKYNPGTNRYTEVHDKGITVTGGKPKTVSYLPSNQYEQDFAVKLGAEYGYFNTYQLYSDNPNAPKPTYNYFGTYGAYHGHITFTTDSGDASVITVMVATPSSTKNCGQSTLSPTIPWDDVATGGALLPEAEMLAN